MPPNVLIRSPESDEGDNLRLYLDGEDDDGNLLPAGSDESKTILGTETPTPPTSPTLPDQQESPEE